jgi:hypothetical protein
MNGTVPWKAELPWRSITHSNRAIAHFADATLKHIAHPEFAPDLPDDVRFGSRLCENPY